MRMIWLRKYTIACRSSFIRVITIVGSNRSQTHQPPIDLLRPYEADRTNTSACNPAVGNVKNNGPEILNSA